MTSMKSNKDIKYQFRTYSSKNKNHLQNQSKQDLNDYLLKISSYKRRYDMLNLEGTNLKSEDKNNTENLTILHRSDKKRGPNTHAEYKENYNGKSLMTVSGGFDKTNWPNAHAEYSSVFNMVTVFKVVTLFFFFGKKNLKIQNLIFST